LERRDITVSDLRSFGFTFRFVLGTVGTTTNSWYWPEGVNKEGSTEGGQREADIKRSSTAIDVNTDFLVHCEARPLDLIVNKCGL
jgi:hypothetical protein